MLKTFLEATSCLVGESALRRQKRVAMAPSGWSNDPTRKLLEHDLLTGVIPLQSSPGFMPKDIQRMRPEYMDMRYDLWTSRLYSARQRHRTHKTQAVDHGAALERSRAMYPKKAHNERGEPRWEGSEAASLLKQDVANGEHLGVSKAELRASRPEYLEFSAKVFRGHVHQEVKTQKFYAQQK
jgi:hypothetical protein